MSKTKRRQDRPVKARQRVDRAGEGDGGAGQAVDPGASRATGRRTDGESHKGRTGAKRVPDDSTANAAPATTSPPGQRLFDMPYSTQVPNPVRKELGLASLVARAGHNAGYDIDVTLLDAADHRLIRTGVLLAHRVLDGRGEWYLGAPDWVPLLPAELILPMGQADLPGDLAERVRPFRRGAPLAPVAALRCERREFALRNDDKQTVALLRDDKVTVRRNGLTTARYREVMLTPVGPGLDAAQADWLRQCLSGGGGTELDRFPRLVRRLGAPATGPPDLPTPASLTDGTYGQFLTQLLGVGAHDLIAADLALIGNRPKAEQRLDQAVSTLRGRLEGLSEVLGADWVSEAVEDLDWLVAPLEGPSATPAGGGLGASAPAGRLTGLGSPSGAGAARSDDGQRWGVCLGRLRSPRYLSLLERLVAAARAPRTGTGTAQPADEGVDALYAATLPRFIRAADRLAVEGTAHTWEAAWSAAEEVGRVMVIRALVDPDGVAKDRERLRPAFALLNRIVSVDRALSVIAERVHELTPADAFEAGQRFERERGATRTLRSEFLTRWAKIRRKLG